MLFSIRGRVQKNGWKLLTVVFDVGEMQAELINRISQKLHKFHSTLSVDMVDRHALKPGEIM
jgi:hypothetical protein